jgi:hypothetical protein
MAHAAPLFPTATPSLLPRFGKLFLNLCKPNYTSQALLTLKLMAFTERTHRTIEQILRSFTNNIIIG